MSLFTAKMGHYYIFNIEIDIYQLPPDSLVGGGRRAVFVFWRLAYAAGCQIDAHRSPNTLFKILQISLNQGAARAAG